MSIDLAIAEVPADSHCGSSMTLRGRSSVRTSTAMPENGAGQGRADAPLLPSAESVIALDSVIEPQAVSLRSLIADFVQLTKPRIVVMVLVTTVASAMVAAGGLFAASDLLWLLLGTALIAGSAGSANQVWERGIDATMPRTAKRPLPGDRMSVTTAVVFTAVIGILGTAILATAFGANSAIVGLATWGLYVLVYTPLKTRTAWNTTVGAVAGALPILIGYTALGGELTDATGWLLVGVLVTWQYPHFMAIAWMYRRQYAEAGFQMTTTVEPTGRSAAIQSVTGSFALIACGVLLCSSSSQMLSSMLSSVAVMLVVYPMLRASLNFARQRDDVQARRLLRSSLLVLPAVLLIVTLRVFW